MTASQPSLNSLLVVICGPTGAGKSTVLNGLLDRHPKWRPVESYTTRAPRVNESDAKKYHFVSEEEFTRLVKEGDIVEYERYAGHLYGTSRSSLEQALSEAPVVLMDVRYQGVKALRQLFPDALYVYLRINTREARRRLQEDARRKGTPRSEVEARLQAVASLNRHAKEFTQIVDSLPGDIEGTTLVVERVILAACPDDRS